MSKWMMKVTASTGDKSCSTHTERTVQQNDNVPITSLSIRMNSIRWPRGCENQSDHRRPRVLELSFFENWV